MYIMLYKILLTDIVHCTGTAPLCNCLCKVILDFFLNYIQLLLLAPFLYLLSLELDWTQCFKLQGLDYMNACIMNASMHRACMNHQSVHLLDSLSSHRIITSSATVERIKLQRSRWLCWILRKQSVAIKKLHRNISGLDVCLFFYLNCYFYNTEKFYKVFCTLYCRSCWPASLLQFLHHVVFLCLTGILLIRLNLYRILL